jgi:hypothetical protein
MSISERLHLLFEIIRVGKLRKLMFDDEQNYKDLNHECGVIDDYEYICSEYAEEPRLYEFRNFKINKRFNNKKFILNVIKMTDIHALRYFKNILTIDLKNNDDKQFVREIIKINPIGLYNLPFNVIIDYDIASDVAEHYGGILEFSVKEFRCNKQFVEKCYRNHISSLMYADDKLLDDEEFMFNASVFNLDALEYLSDKLKNDIIFFDKLIKLKPDKVNIILQKCSNNVLKEYKSKSIKDYELIGFYSLFKGKISMHKPVPINLKTKNEIRKYLKNKKFKYNHYFDGRDEPEMNMYLYY